MNLVYLNKDLTSVTSGVIIHGVNCQGVMGAGVAKSLSDKWPVVKQKYLTILKQNMKEGLVQPVHVAEGIYVFNCFTQKYYGRAPNMRYASPLAIQTCMDKVAGWMLRNELYKMYMPYIGCNLGGLK